jgi:hypothetical protein
LRPTFLIFSPKKEGAKNFRPSSKIFFPFITISKSLSMDATTLFVVVAFVVSMTGLLLITVGISYYFKSLSIERISPAVAVNPSMSTLQKPRCSMNPSTSTASSCSSITRHAAYLAMESRTTPTTPSPTHISLELGTIPITTAIRIKKAAKAAAFLGNRFSQFSYASDNTSDSIYIRRDLKEMDAEYEREVVDDKRCQGLYHRRHSGNSTYSARGESICNSDSNSYNDEVVHYSVRLSPIHSNCAALDVCADSEKGAIANSLMSSAESL